MIPPIVDCVLPVLMQLAYLSIANALHRVDSFESDQICTAYVVLMKLLFYIVTNIKNNNFMLWFLTWFHFFLNHRLDYYFMWPYKDIKFGLLEYNVYFKIMKNKIRLSSSAASNVMCIDVWCNDNSITYVNKSWYGFK